MTHTTSGCPSMPISIALISHRDLVRLGVQRAVEAAPHFRMVGYATGMAMARALLAQANPQVVLIDAASVCGLPSMVTMVRETVRGSKIVALCGVGATVQDEGWSGPLVDAVVLTVQPVVVLIATIESLFDGTPAQERVGDDRAANPAMRGAMPGMDSAKGLGGTWPATLTEREREVIKALAQGLSNKAIAASLGISHITVRHHLTNVFAKLGVKGRQALLLHGHRSGFLALQGLD